MRKTCKINPKNQSKIRQKSSKNTPKKHNENTTTQFQPKGRQRCPKIDRQGGKGGIQDGILLEKKKNIAKTRPTAGKGCMREGYTQTVTESQHAPAVGRTRPGGESRLPAAIVPPPGLGKIVCMRKFARNLIPGSMQECFFTNFCLKN